jgi:hypothetical protein
MKPSMLFPPEDCLDLASCVGMLSEIYGRPRGGGDETRTAEEEEEETCSQQRSLPGYCAWVPRYTTCTALSRAGQARMPTVRKGYDLG